MRTWANGDVRPLDPSASPPKALKVSMPITSVCPYPAGRRAHALVSTLIMSVHSGAPRHVRSVFKS